MDQQSNERMVNGASAVVSANGSLDENQQFSSLPGVPPVNEEDEAAYCRWADDGGFCLHPCDQADGFYESEVIGTRL